MQSGKRTETRLTRSAALLLFIVLFSAGFSGCTDSDTAGTHPPATVTVIPATTGTVPRTAQISIPAATDRPDAKIFGRFSRAEYRENITQTLAPNPRYQWEKIDLLERTETVYRGVPAIHEKITITMDYAEWSGDMLVKTKDGWVIISDRFYDVSTNKLLGGTWAGTIKGAAQPPEDLPADARADPEDKPGTEMGIAPFGHLNIPLRDEGTESVTVPAGTWPDARKYAGTFRDGTPVTFWVVQDVPVPVQYRILNKYLDGENPVQNYELRDWG